MVEDFDMYFRKMKFLNLKQWTKVEELLDFLLSAKHNDTVKKKLGFWAGLHLCERGKKIFGKKEKISDLDYYIFLRAPDSDDKATIWGEEQNSSSWWKNCDTFLLPIYSLKSKKNPEIQKSRNPEIQNFIFFGKSKKPSKIRSFWHQRISGSSFRCRDIARNPKNPEIQKSRNPKLQKSRNPKFHIFWKIQKSLKNPVVLTPADLQ